MQQLKQRETSTFTRTHAMHLHPIFALKVSGVKVGGGTQEPVTLRERDREIERERERERQREGLSL